MRGAAVRAGTPQGTALMPCVTSSLSHRARPSSSGATLVKASWACEPQGGLGSPPTSGPPRRPPSGTDTAAVLCPCPAAREK